MPGGSVSGTSVSANRLALENSRQVRRGHLKRDLHSQRNRKGDSGELQQSTDDAADNVQLATMHEIPNEHSRAEHFKPDHEQQK